MRILPASLIAASIWIGGCSPEPESVPPISAPAPWESNPAPVALTGDALLRPVLPAETLAYLRLPSPWDLVAAPRGDLLHEVMADASHVEAWERVREGLRRRVQDATESSVGSTLGLLTFALRSPVELALLAPPQSAFPVLLLAARLDTTAHLLNETLQHLAQTNPELTLLQPIDAHGRGLVGIGPAALHLRFDATAGTLHAVGGLGVTDQLVDTLLGQLEAPPASSPVAADEMDLDASGRGLLLWLDVAELQAAASRVLPPAQQRALSASPLASVATAAAGWGTRDGKGRLRAQARLRQAWLRPYTGADLQLDIASAGEPDGVVALTLPSPAQFVELERLALSRAAPQALAWYREAKQTLHAEIGIAVEDLLGAVGPELVWFEDNAGRFLALRLRHPQRWQQVLETVLRTTGYRHEVHERDGGRYHHLILPPLIQGTELSQPMPPMVAALLAGETHLFWLDEGEWLVAAEVPQALRDRRSRGRPVALDDWLGTRQHQRTDATLLLGSTTVNNGPRTLYYGYLQLLLYLGDVAGAPVDLYELPSARQLHLPARGTYGLQVDARDDLLALEVTFEHNPLEFLLVQDASSIAVLGILAAVAIPAYHDYTMRAHVQAAFTQTAPIRLAVEEVYARTGGLPGGADLEAIRAAAGDVGDSGVEVLDGGTVALRLSGADAVRGRRLLLVPTPEGGALEWRCEGDVEERHLPARCRE